MRQIGTVADEQAARKFADYLRTKGIFVSIEPDRAGSMIWVHDEDHLEAARREYAEFSASPDAPVYREAGREADRLRIEEVRRVREARKNLVNVGQRWRAPSTARYPITLLLTAISVGIAIWSHLGSDTSVVTRFTIVPYEREGNLIYYAPLSSMWYMEPWRLVTPIFIHFGFLHILFDMLMLLQLGQIVEMVRGSWRYALFVLLIAISSNVAQYVAPASWGGGPTFGGMSGVVYGLFGYLWMKSRYEPGCGFVMPQNAVVWMIGWFVMCVVGIIPHVANVVHGVGLLVGMILGRWSSLWRSMR